MAGLPARYYRNYTSDDRVYDDNHGKSGEASVDIETLGWDAPTGYTFKEWNMLADGTGIGHQPGDTALDVQFAIWEEIPQSVKYITNDQSLTAVADAIRTKGGTSAQLVYPEGFVSAINDIQTGTDVSDTTATAADVLSGKYFYTASGTKMQGTIVSKTSSDLTSNGATVTVPAGHYASNASKSIASGSATTPATTITTAPSISVDASGLITATNSKTQSVTPSVSAGYVSTGTAGTITVNGSNTSQLTTQGAQTITPGTTDQTIASGKYLTGAQTIKGDANLVAANIAKDVTIFGVTGTHEGGGGGNPVAEENDVIFIDYDGTIRYSYSASEFANMTALPANPTHDGLTAQGWNWTLSDAKTYVANCGGLVIGQMYTTNDGKTKLFMDIDSGDQRSVEIRWSQTVSNGVSIDWGDGSSLSKKSGTGLVYTSHTYASNGSYIISIDCTSGKCVLGANISSRCILGNASNSNYFKLLRLKKVYIGNNVDGFNSYAFQNCTHLSAIAIPKTVTSISGYAFDYCNHIQSITIPSEIQTINPYLVSHSLTKFVSFPNSITTFPSNFVFSVCYGIKRIHIGNNCTSIGNSSINSLNGCTMATIGSCTTAGNNFCRDMNGLTKLSLPATLTTIGDYAFYANYTIMEYHFKSATPPSIGTGAFLNINSDCKIYVPASSLSAYQNASNWSNYASYMVGE